MTIREAVIDDIKQIQRARNSVTENAFSDANLLTVHIRNNNRMKISKSL